MVPALNSWMTPLFRGPPPGLLPLFSASWPRPLRGLFPAGVPQTTVSTCEVTSAAKFNPSLQLGNHAPWPTPPLVCGVEVDRCTPERTGAAMSPSHTVHGALAAVCPRPCSPLALIKPPESCLRLGNHQAAGVGSPSLIHAASSPWWPQYLRLRCFNCSANCHPATLPLIMPNGSESHHPLCLSPGPAHRRCDSE